AGRRLVRHRMNPVCRPLLTPLSWPANAGHDGKGSALQTLNAQRPQILVPLLVLVAAEFVQIVPREQPAVVAVVEADAYGVVADRLQPLDLHMPLAAQGDLMVTAMALHLGAGR